MWDLVKSYLDEYGVVRHQIESFNYFCDTLLPHIINEHPPLRAKGRDGCEHVIQLCNLSLLPPGVREVDGSEVTITPHTTRLRGITYASSVLVDVVHDMKVSCTSPINRRVYRGVLLVQIPVMLKSCLCVLSHSDSVPKETNECPLDEGGYFIINGIEKVLLSQEKLHTNRIFVFSMKQQARQMLSCEVRSCHELKLRSTSTLFLNLHTPRHGDLPEIVCRLPFIDTNLPVYALFVLLGVPEHDDIMSIVFGKDNDEGQTDGSAPCKDRSAMQHMLSSMIDSNLTTLKNRNDVILWMAQNNNMVSNSTFEKRSRYIDHIISNELIPHVGLDRTTKTNRLKALFIGRMVLRLLQTYVDPAKWPCDDRDDYANKRVDSAGVLMSLLFRQVYRGFFKSLHSHVHKLIESNKMCFTNAADLITHKKLTGAVRYAFATGNWGLQKGKIHQSGVAQALSRMTMVSYMSNVRRINTPINREGKAPKPRLLHISSWGLVCPAETPEGASCGLVKHLAMLAHVRVGCPTSSLYEYIRKDESIMSFLRDLDLQVSGTMNHNEVFVYINGVPVMCTHVDNTLRVIARLRDVRRNAQIPSDCSFSICTHTGDIMIDTDSGCLMRPLIVANKQHEIEKERKRFAHEKSGEKSLWSVFVEKGIIEYIDKLEEKSCRVALCQADAEGDSHSYTHIEIHPSLINGVCASLIPFCDHNQAPRNVYQSAMCKQAVGVSALNFQRRMETATHTLTYPQIPLVVTQMERILSLQRAPSGENPVVCIMCYTGFNQEDSLIVNESAINRGLFLSMVHKTNKDEEKMSGADIERFERPNIESCSGIRVAHYDKLREDGIVEPGTWVQQGDAILGKTMNVTDIDEGRACTKRDKSVIVRGEAGVVDGVFTSVNKEGQKYVKVRIRSFRKPVIGDKLCYSPDHEVLTMDKGWQLIENVDVNDRILTLDTSSRTMTFEGIVEKFDYPVQASEEVVLVESPEVSLCVTQNHSLLVSLTDSPNQGDFSLMCASSCHKFLKKGVLDKVFMTSLLPPYRSSPGLGFAPQDHLPTKITFSNQKEFLFLWATWFIGHHIYRVSATDSTGNARELTIRLQVQTSCCADRFWVAEKRLKAACLACGLEASVHPDWNPTAPKLSYLSLTVYDEDVCEWFNSQSMKEAGPCCFSASGAHLDSDMAKHIMLALSCASFAEPSPVVLRLPMHLRDDVASRNRWIGCVQVIGAKAGLHLIADIDAAIIAEANQGNFHIEASNIWTEKAAQIALRKVHCVTVPTGVFLVRRRSKMVWCGNSSRHGQKGVIGMVLPQEDMPFTIDGITPDIIVNPHAIPSRMTIGQLMECLLSKASAVRMRQGDGTPFSNMSISRISDELHKIGYHRYGNERLFNGFSGEMMPGAVFIGPTHYQRLKHMVIDKEHSRARGPVALMTRQPMDGRARDGGLRFGEMERDCIIAHGAAAVLRERLFEQSDAFIVPVCRTCGMLCLPQTLSSPNATCSVCKGEAQPLDLRLPYAFKLFIQELMALHIVPRLRIK